MVIVLAGLGLALVALGALVLLRFPDRPGGNVRLLGLEVSSVGAGLPLIALGALVAIVAVAQQGEDGEPNGGAGSASPRGAQVAAESPTGDGSCFAAFFAAAPTVPEARQRRLPAEAEDVDVLAASEPKGEELGLVLTDRGAPLGAIKLAYDVDAKQTAIDDVVDASCARVRWTAEGTPEPSPSLVNQYTRVLLDFGARSYVWELKPDGEYETELHRFER